MRFDPVPDVEADWVILAGDIGFGSPPAEEERIQCGFDFAESRGRPVIYVLGNHEFWDHSVPGLQEELWRRSAGSERVRFLENAVEIDGGVRFLGGTLWTDFNLMGKPDIGRLEAKAYMNDYVRIRKAPQGPALLPVDTLDLHRRSLRWLVSQLQEPFDGKTVIVTHHAPSPRSLKLDYRSDPRQSAYASDLEYLFHRFRIDLWVHGHAHRAVDYRIGSTRVVSNPRGYPDQPTGFTPELVVEI